MTPYKRLFESTAGATITFHIGDTEYEATGYGEVEPGQRGSRFEPAYPPAFLPDTFTVLPLSIQDIVDTRLEDLKMTWESLWGEGTFSAANIPEYLETWNKDAIAVLAKEIRNHLPGYEDLSDDATILKAFLDNEKSPSDYLDRLRAAYFPMGGKKLELQTYKKFGESLEG